MAKFDLDRSTHMLVNYQSLSEESCIFYPAPQLARLQKQGSRLHWPATPCSPSWSADTALLFHSSARDSLHLLRRSIPTRYIDMIKSKVPGEDAPPGDGSYTVRPPFLPYFSLTVHDQRCLHPWTNLTDNMYQCTNERKPAEPSSGAPGDGG